METKDNAFLLSEPHVTSTQIKKFCSKKQVSERHIHLSGSSNSPIISNSVVNTKYNIFTFIPLFLYYQFSQPLNIVFLLIALTQFYPPLQVGFLFTYISPLALVLSITMTKELYDDVTRWIRDKEINNTLYTQVTPSGLIRIKASNIKVGDILEIHHRERIPADIIILSTHDESGTVFIKTDQLDGETDWKLRKSLACTQRIQPVTRILNTPGVVTVKAPDRNIYRFVARFEANIDGIDIIEGVGLDNTLWANTTLANGSCIGIVVYAGKETRIALNSREPSNKLGMTDKELNRLAFYLILIMMLIALLVVSLSGFNQNSYIQFFRMILLLSTIIPISLRVNLDFAKIYYCIKISRDPKLGNAKPRNSTIPEELGRIHFLLSDKTGTLTRNEMTLKRVYLENWSINLDDKAASQDFLQLLKDNMEKYRDPIADSGMVKKRKRDIDMICRDMVTALAICNNVTPVYEDKQKTFQASSPDEIALVEYSCKAGVDLYQRTSNHIILRYAETNMEFKILQIFPFTSATKKMGIIVRHSLSNKIIFYIKGAEDAIKGTLASNNSVVKMLEDCEDLATGGYRTLVIAQRTMTEEDYEDFNKKLEFAKSLMENRDEMCQDVIKSIEKDMDYLGVTGVEDKLQHKVDKIITRIKSAGIRVWMLTGDKIETAKCIAISTGLKKVDNQFIEFTNIESIDKVESINEMDNKVIIIDGNTLAVVLEFHSKRFVEIAKQAAGVICCRVSPTQKSEIVEALQKHTNQRVCAIGDGGNDVGMIQAAHVGIGIEGKEGKQASLAADFSISEFKYASRLILWHGRLSYLRTAKLSHFIFHRGLVYAIIQALFTIVFYYCAIPIYNGYLMLGYTTAFTSMPVFALIMDTDITYRTIKEYPILYQSLQLGRALNVTRFLFWMWKSIYQGSVIILLALVMFPYDSFINIVAITFSALILTELLNVASQIETWNIWIAGSEIISFILYAICILLLKNYFNLQFIVTVDFFWKVLMITAISWCPLHFTKIIKNKSCPSKSRQLKYN
jgi:phospholipid-translocating ATPase